MSTTTSPAELEVPREFLPAFVIAANLDVMRHAEGLDNDLSLDYTDESRRQDDAKLASLTESIERRASVLRTLDDNRSLPIALVQSYVSDAIGNLRGDLLDLTHEPDDAVTAAEVATRLRDLIAWAARHDLALDAKKATP